VFFFSSRRRHTRFSRDWSSDVCSSDLSTILGKKIGVSVGSINHLYLLSVLESLGATPDDVELINTAPPDLGVALQTGGIDVAIEIGRASCRERAETPGGAAA